MENTENLSTSNMLKRFICLLKFSGLIMDLTGSLGFSLERKYTTDRETMELMPKKRLMQT